jgi:hypothetical protein
MMTGLLGGRGAAFDQTLKSTGPAFWLLVASYS